MNVMFFPECRLTNKIHEPDVEGKNRKWWNFVAGSFSSPGQIRRHPEFAAAAFAHELQAFLQTFNQFDQPYLVGLVLPVGIFQQGSIEQ